MRVKLQPTRYKLQKPTWRYRLTVKRYKLQKPTCYKLARCNVRLTR